MRPRFFLMYFDTHAHLNFKAFHSDWREVAEDALSHGIYLMVVGSQYKTSLRAVEMADSFNYGVWAAVGLHPLHLEKREVAAEDEYFGANGEDYNNLAYRQMLENPKVKAIGEIGLDYFRVKDEPSQAKQREVFIQQLDLASEVNKPVIVHSREAHKDTLGILSGYQSKVSGVLHCYSGSLKEAKKYIEMGYYISFTGLITFSDRWKEVIKEIPIERIMAETDCPYMAPEPNRGSRNTPVNVKLVVGKIAEIKNIEKEIAENIIYENSLRFF
jgi:TatD DNase family protein